MHAEGSGAGRWRHLTRSALLRRTAAAGVALGLTSWGGERLLATNSAAPTHDGPTTHQFYSRPDLIPPVITVTQAPAPEARGLLFLAPFTGPGQRGALIADTSGQPVWFQPTTPLSVTNLGVSTYKNAPVLTWWEGTTDSNGLGEGECIIADQRYRTIARVRAGNGYFTDLHEFKLTAQSTALISAQRTVQVDLRKLGGSRTQEVIDSAIQEIDVATGDVLMHWSGIGRIAFDESYRPVIPGKPFDYLHLNSVAVSPDGTALLLSARDTWALYLISRASGDILWRLGGKRSDFEVDPAARFAWQHDARWPSATEVTLFDDGAAAKVPTQPQSRGLSLRLDSTKKRAQLAQAYVHHPSLLATAMGSVQTLPNDNVLVGWGSQPQFTEYRPDGIVVFDATLPPRGSSYRTLRFPWIGQPATQPAIARGSNPGSGRVYVSWNGATQVHSWQLLSGASPKRLTVTTSAPRNGFETSLATPPEARYAAAIALDATSAPIGWSPTIRV